MKNKGIIIFLIILAVVIVAIIAGDYLSEKPDRSDPNPFAYDVNEFKKVDSTLIQYKETKNFKLGFDEPVSITVKDKKIFVSGDNKLQVINVAGNLLQEITFSGKIQTAEVCNDTIYTSVNNQIIVTDQKGNIIQQWEPLGANSVITALACDNANVFVADAGNRKILRYSKSGYLHGEFDGKADEGELHGFIIPSPYFDMNINAWGELWVVNPGLHALENYTPDGQLREHWNKTSMLNDGFSGCCNPAHFAFLPDGRFVTSEKGLVRIKTYKTSGEFEGIVAPPAKFVNEEEAPDVATDDMGNIYALDFHKKVIRVFEPKK